MIPKQINNIPAKISKYLVWRCLIFPPVQNPIFELINVIKAIKRAGLRILFPYRESEIPAEKASIDVAIPIRNKHFISIHNSFFLSGELASIINLKPRYEKIKNTIKSA